MQSQSGQPRVDPQDGAKRENAALFVALGLSVVLLLGVGKVLLHVIAEANKPRLPRQPWEF